MSLFFTIFGGVRDTYTYSVLKKSETFVTNKFEHRGEIYKFESLVEITKKTYSFPWWSVGNSTYEVIIKDYKTKKQVMGFK